ncbi:hypothetical protein [Deinococcus ficus]|uniref:Uncharacterized protein n=1 Tax=Deinococcus ficus TaxID=317577 RepID=A0A221T346_9DEIO|nr:hypothetical protein [Deinococcus ficus]ASN83328.1 hypothetical protein DFI_19210 [Deinococcus ficus]
MLNLLEDVRADRHHVRLRLPRGAPPLTLERADAARLGEALLDGRAAQVTPAQGGQVLVGSASGQLTLTWDAETGRVGVLETDDVPLHRLILAGALCHGEPGGRAWVAPGVTRTHLGSGVNLLSLHAGTADLLALTTGGPSAPRARYAGWVTAGGGWRLEVRVTHHAYRQTGTVQFTPGQARRLGWRLREAADDIPALHLPAAERAAEAEVHDRLLQICMHDPGRTRALSLPSARRCQQLASRARSAEPQHLGPSPV